MIEFKWSKVDAKNSNTPILKDSDIDDLAEMLLQDYKPKLLHEPSKINYWHFLESYLGATVEVHDIYYEEEAGPIWGATAFNEEALKIFDREHSRISHIRVGRGSIIMDNSVMEDGKEGLALFTGLHEGGHWWLHPGVFTRNHKQLSLFGEATTPSVVCCRRPQIENSCKKRSFKTGEEWREHQANYFASAVAMPKATFIPFCQSYLKEAGICEKRIVTGIDHRLDRIAFFDLPFRVTEVYGVSMQAATVKLKKFGLIADKKSLCQTTLL